MFTFSPATQKLFEKFPERCNKREPSTRYILCGEVVWGIINSKPDECDGLAPESSKFVDLDRNQDQVLNFLPSENLPVWYLYSYGS